MPVPAIAPRDRIVSLNHPGCTTLFRSIDYSLLNDAVVSVVSNLIIHILFDDRITNLTLTLNDHYAFRQSLQL